MLPISEKKNAFNFVEFDSLSENKYLPRCRNTSTRRQIYSRSIASCSTLSLQSSWWKIFKYRKVTVKYHEFSDKYYKTTQKLLISAINRYWKPPIANISISYLFEQCCLKIRKFSIFDPLTTTLIV